MRYLLSMLIGVALLLAATEVLAGGPAGKGPCPKNHMPMAGGMKGSFGGKPGKMMPFKGEAMKPDHLGGKPDGAGKGKPLAGDEKLIPKSLPRKR